MLSGLSRRSWEGIRPKVALARAGRRSAEVKRLNRHKPPEASYPCFNIDMTVRFARTNPPIVWSLKSEQQPVARSLQPAASSLQPAAWQPAASPQPAACNLQPAARSQQQLRYVHITCNRCAVRSIHIMHILHMIYSIRTIPTYDDNRFMMHIRVMRTIRTLCTRIRGIRTMRIPYGQLIHIMHAIRIQTNIPA